MTDRQHSKRHANILESVPRYVCPQDIVFDGEGNVILEDAELSVYLYCIKIINIKSNSGAFEFAPAKISKSIGYSQTAVYRAFAALLTKKFFVKIADSLGRAMFSLCTPTGTAFSSSYEAGQSLRTLFLRAGLFYDEIPCHTVDTLAHLRGAPLVLQLSAVRKAQIVESVKFSIEVEEWRTRAGVYKDRVRPAWKVPEFEALVKVTCAEKSRTAGIELFHPTTHDCLKDVRPAAIEKLIDKRVESQYEEEQRERSQSNVIKYMQCELEACIAKFYPEAILDGNKEWVVECPLCHGTKNGHRKATPTLRISTVPGTRFPYGVLNCGAFLGRDETEKCEYGKGIMPYHYLAQRLNIDKKVAQRMYVDFIISLREEKQQ